MGGVASGTVLNSGGVESVMGGTAIGTTVNVGGLLDIFSGGTGLGTVINSGGVEFALSGGTAGATTISGGELVLNSGSVVTGPITFVGPNGTLFLQNPAMPLSVISSFLPGDHIDLGGVSFDSAGTVQLLSGNVLQITENGRPTSSTSIRYRNSAARLSACATTYSAAPTLSLARL